MSWYYLFDNVTSKLISETSVTPDQLREGIDVLELSERVPKDQEWDAEKQEFKSRPVPVLKSVVDDMVNDPELTVVLDTAQKDNLKQIIRKYLPGSEFYTE